MRHVLIAVCGRTPQIITEMAWALYRQRNITLSEVRVITTREGLQFVLEKLLDPAKGQFGRFLRDYGINPDTVRFSEDTIHVLKDPGGKDLQDIRTSEENDWARNQIFEIVEGLTRDPSIRLHGSIAGGRKSMGFLLGSAVHFFGRAQDRLYHVLVAPQEIEIPGTSFYYPPSIPEPVTVAGTGSRAEETLKIRRNGTLQELLTSDVTVELAEIPFCRLSEVVRFVAPGRYDQEGMELTQQAIDRYAETMRREHERKVESGINELFGEIIGSSPAMRRLKGKIRSLAPFDLPVLITGPTGAGKELVARAIHRASKRSKEPLVADNCANFTRDLAYSRLFGHEKGAYTGAVSAHRGLFEQANGGTLFLDEIDSLPPDVQAMLLRVLEDGEVRRMGSEKTIRVNVRLIAATNKDLVQEAARGAFRDDLLNRIHRPLAIPTLKERAEDIPLLAHHFLKRFEQREGKRIRGFTREALRAMQTYVWPGNVRELIGCIETAAVYAPEGGFIGAGDLNLSSSGGGMRMKGPSLDQIIGQAEKDAIQGTLSRNAGNAEKAAKALGIHRTTLQRKIKALKIEA